MVLLDDVHWAEPTLLDLIDHVADWSKDVPIMVIALSRPDLLEARPTWGGGKVNATTVLLEPLTDGDSEALVANLLGSGTVATDAKDRIIEAAGGNPFFVEEIVSMLIDDGLWCVREARGSRPRICRTSRCRRRSPRCSPPGWIGWSRRSARRSSWHPSSEARSRSTPSGR